MGSQRRAGLTVYFLIALSNVGAVAVLAPKVGTYFRSCYGYKIM